MYRCDGAGICSHNSPPAKRFLHQSHPHLSVMMSHKENVDNLCHSKLHFWMSNLITNEHRHTGVTHITTQWPRQLNPSCLRSNHTDTSKRGDVAERWDFNGMRTSLWTQFIQMKIKEMDRRVAEPEPQLAKRITMLDLPQTLSSWIENHRRPKQRGSLVINKKKRADELPVSWHANGLTGFRASFFFFQWRWVQAFFLCMNG